MVRMGTIWDRAVEVMRGRSGILVQIAVLTIFLPAVIRSAFALYAGTNPGLVAVGGVLAIVTTVLAMFGGLALVAVASDPAHDAAAAYTRARQRLLPAIGLTFLFGLVIVVALLPIVALFFGAGLHFGTQVTAPPRPGLLAVAGLYGLVLFFVFIWLAARLILLNPVIVNERLGVGSFARSFALTRGMTWRIIGVLLLFGLVVLVAVGAVQSVTALVFRLLLGGDAIATALFLASIAVSAVTTATSIVQSAFVAQLYNAVTGREAAAAFE